MAMVSVFMISVTHTIQRQNVDFIRKTEECRKLTRDPKTYQICELNGNFYTIFVFKICSVRLLIFCVLIVINVY